MDEKFFTVKEFELNNHCPECYSREGLQLTFKQKFVENLFYRAITNDTTYAMFCNVCKSDISPSRWTDDIDSVVSYQQKALVPKSATFKLKRLSWILLTLAIVIIIALNVFIFMN
ncbi:MAG: hypothetical protein KDD03_08375 [Gelidibacter sp.]|nr:hypothetical protein [Gelidibacter sp.]